MSRKRKYRACEGAAERKDVGLGSRKVFHRATKGEAVTERFVLGWVRSGARELEQVHDVSVRDMFRVEEVKIIRLHKLSF
jgi:hypothetical protein